MSNAVCAPASRVFSYERVSSTKQGQGSGLQRQSASAAAWCEAQGLVLDQELSLIDSGRSAFKGDHLHGALGRFLALAQAGELGTDPILLVEALDRLSRQEALDALDTILQGLIRSGVRIITLEDGAEYSRRTLRDDASRLIVLVVKVQAAYEYSRRLAMRITDTWNRTRERLRDGVIDRPAIFRPAWCDWDGAQFTLNSYAAVIREALALLRDHGSNAVARMLNEQGTTSPGGKAWTRAGVELLLKDPRIWGTVALNNPRRARKLRDKGITPPPQELLPGLLPPLTTQAAIEEVLALRAQRASHTGLRGPNTQLYWVGQGITTCTCGATCGTVSARTPRKELGGVLR
jgi:DNA invertase Pin-like site-specific DNA recombinase